MSYFCRNSYFKEKEFDLLWLYMAAVPSCLLIAGICRGYLKSSLKRSVPSFMKTMSRILYIDNDRETRNYLEVQIIWQVLEFLKNNEMNFCPIFILFLFCLQFTSAGSGRKNSLNSSVWSGGISYSKEGCCVNLSHFFFNGSNSKEKNSDIHKHAKSYLYDKYIWASLLI